MYKTYRFMNGLDLPERIKEAVTRFYKAYQVLPKAVTVNPNLYDEAVTATKDLGLSIPVEACGGTLLPEVWLAYEQ
jgi:hypothetical protein